LRQPSSSLLNLAISSNIISKRLPFPGHLFLLGYPFST
jgi:hypothetical protein